ncbi:MAG TPA: MCP four helix bundle domain-containing protein, partial [Actinotalea sp.]|nr:MCP four helix bundle domain-containing protein [Actinotalea sp.]
MSVAPPRASFRRFADLGVSLKIMLAISVAAIVATGIGMIGIFQLQASDHRFTALYDENLLGLDEAAALRRNTYDLRLAVTMQLIAADQDKAEYEARIDSSSAAALEMAERYRTLHDLTAAQTAALDDFEAALTSYLDLTRSRTMVAGRDNDVEAWREARAANDAAIDTMMASGETPGAAEHADAGAA